MKKKLLTAICILLSTFLVMWALSKSEFRFENRAQDWYIEKFAKDDGLDIKKLKNSYGVKGIDLIVIDDTSVDREHYPWPRSMYAEIFDYLHTYSKAKIIVFDAVVSSEDKTETDNVLFDNLPKFNRLVAGYTLQEYHKYPKSSSVKLTPEDRDNLFRQKSTVKIKDTRTPSALPDDTAFSNFPDKYLKNISYLGHVQTVIDSDGALRTFSAAMSYKGELYPSLALQAYSALTGITDFVIDDRFLCSNDGCDAFKMPVSTRKEGIGGIFTIVNWYKIRHGADKNADFSHDYYSAIKIIDTYRLLKKGKKIPKGDDRYIDPSIFENKAVFVGGCANNDILHDKKLTPLTASQAGVDYQATVFENLLTQKFMTKMDIMHNLLIILAMGMITLIAIRKFSIRIALLVAAIMLTLYYILTVVMIDELELMLVISPVMFEVIVFAAGYAYQFFIEDKAKQKLQRAMGQYMSKDIMRTVVKNIDEIHVGGKRADVSVMFIDIRGFTTISEQMPPEEVSIILNEYISEVEPVIREHKGVLNKFIGDEIMAIFGEPIHEKNHAQYAVRCADEVLKRIKLLQDKWVEEGKPKIEVGVGICTGEVFIGNIGSCERLEYTVIGDVVNTASRIEAFNKIYKTKFLISQETYTRVRDITDVIMIKDVAVRGKTQKINIYKVLRLVECPQHLQQ